MEPSRARCARAQLRGARAYLGGLGLDCCSLWDRSRVGLEPTTLRLTAECSTIELSRIILRISPPRCLRTLKTTYRKYITSNPIRQHLRTPQFSMAPDCSALRAPAILTKIRKSHRSFHSRCFFAHLRFRVLCLYTSAHASMLICVHPQSAAISLRSRPSTD